ISLPCRLLFPPSCSSAFALPNHESRITNPMPLEIERKFLVTDDSWRAAAHAVIPMAQGYINDMGAMDRGEQKASVRVRIQGDVAYLNLKSRELGHTRQEFDYAIPVEDARALLALCVGGMIDKRRHLVR